MALLLFFATMVVGGRELAKRLWAADWGRARESRETPEAGPFERVANTALFALAVAVALSWALALPKLLTRGGLLLGSAFVFACAVTAWWRTSRAGIRSFPPHARVVTGGLFAWTLDVLPVLVGAFALASVGAFFLWRGSVVFQPSHDGAAYHLPKAAMLVRSHGFQVFDSADVRVSSWPCDYELLLADVMLLDGSDAHTSWLSVAFVALFLLSVAGVAERWWGRGRHVLVPVLVVAAMPVVLLHADTHKNDVLMAALFLLSITSAARWAAGGGRAPLLTALTGVALALGTKLSAPFLVAALAPLAIWGCARRWRAGEGLSRREVVACCACGIVLFLALGGTVYLQNAIETGRPLGNPPNAQPTYGDWGNLFRFPYLAFARPFSASTENVWVPWKHAYWHWARYDLYFSEWGKPTSLLLAVLPLGIARYARRARGVQPATLALERVAASLVALLAFLLILPIHTEPMGFFGTFVRYTIFFPVLVPLWTVTPAVAEMDTRGAGWRVLAGGTLLAGVAVLARSALREAVNDYREPLDYALEAAKHPEARRTRRSRWGEDRACVVLDTLAGPDDTIAIDAGALDSWPYYCFGAALGRNVIFLHPERGLPVPIPDEALWVAIDHIGAIAFGHPAFHDLGDWDEYLLKGTSSAEDLAVFEQMNADPRFRLVRRNESTNQAVFQRIEPPSVSLRSERRPRK